MKSDKALILITGTNEQVTLKDWYANSWLWNVDNRSIANLQLVIEGASDYSVNSTNKLNNRKIQQFDFGSLVGKFDAARAPNPRMTSWNLAPSFAAAHVGGTDTTAFGGDLAYQYARTGNLENVSVPAAQIVLEAAEFGVAKQALAAPAPLTAWGVTSSVLSFHVGAAELGSLGGESAAQDGTGLEGKPASAQAAGDVTGEAR